MPSLSVSVEAFTNTDAEEVTVLFKGSVPEKVTLLRFIQSS